jgi:anthranilate phosphoribosyltransferase
LIGQINYDLFYGRTGSATSTVLVNMVAALAASDPAAKVTAALQVALAPPEFAIQK